MRLSHNTLVQKFCWRVNKIATQALPKRSKPVLIFDRGFARGQHLMQWFMRRKIRFVILDRLDWFAKDVMPAFRNEVDT